MQETYTPGAVQANAPTITSRMVYLRFFCRYERDWGLLDRSRNVGQSHGCSLLVCCDMLWESLSITQHAGEKVMVWLGYSPQYLNGRVERKLRALVETKLPMGTHRATSGVKPGERLF